MSDKVAIIGLGLTLPGGAEDADSFWSVLADKVDATIDVPADRWDKNRFYAPYGSEKPGKMYVTRGGFLQRKIADFDPLHFGISPREASIMDVQQRLILEAVSKTFQDAGVVERDYKGRSVGVFIGAFCMDSYVQAASADNRNWYITQSITGSTATMLSNRISYIYDLKGPSLTIDTACSSSLVATHYAVASILTGECDMALVGGVNAMTQPQQFIKMCKGRLLSKDGKCFTWDARANGYARGEGAGMLLLKRLSRAEADGDHIYAVIEATGVNQDGTTMGITSPNPESQAELIRTVLQKAHIRADDIDYLEAHGTGTQAGDKAETSALEAVFAPGRERKLLIGSVKSNIGHLEAAAGVAGLIKAALCLQHGKVPGNLHFETPNPDIPFAEMCLQVATELTEIPRVGERQYVGVNGFGYGGTNAHVIVGSAPQVKPRAAAAPSASGSGQALLLPLSGTCVASLKALAQQYQQFLEQNAHITTGQFLRRISLKRNHYPYRAMVRGDSRQELMSRLELLAAGTHGPGIVSSNEPCAASQLVFVYSGMGPQWWGMGRELLREQPLFRDRIRALDEVFKPIANWSLLEELSAGEAQSRVARTEFAQPLNFAIQVALTDLWASWGIKPDAVVGHSVGEVSAAYVAGILTLEDALLVSYYRSYWQSTLANTGGMLAVGLSQDALAPRLEEFSERVAIAAVNSPGAVTLAGELIALQTLAANLEEEGIFNRMLQVEVPYHSPLMNPIEADLKQSLASLRPRAACIPCYSTVTGKLSEPGDYGADYWWHNVRESVLFAKAITSLCDDGFTDFLEIGPHPVLSTAMKEVLSAKGISGKVFASLNRKTPELPTLLDSLGALYTNGHELAWAALNPGADRHFSLPPFPWQKASYGYGSIKYLQDKFGEGEHPILYRNLMHPCPAWEVELSESLFPYLADHVIGNKIILPGAFYIEAALAVSKRLLNQDRLSLKNIELERFLVVPSGSSDEEKRLLSQYTPKSRSVAIYSATTSPEESWVYHMGGEVAELPQAIDHLTLPSSDLLQQRDMERFYQEIASAGLHYGPCFRPIRKLACGDGIVHAELVNTLESDSRYLLSPALLDGVFQTMFAFGQKFTSPFVPVKIDRLTLLGAVPDRCQVIGRLQWSSAASLKADFSIFDMDGQVVAAVQGVTCRAFSQVGSDQTSLPLYHLAWHEQDLDEVLSDERVDETQLVLNFGGAHAGHLVDCLSQQNTLVQMHGKQFSEAALEQLALAHRFDTVYLVVDSQSELEHLLPTAVAHVETLCRVVQVLHRVYAEKSVELILCTNNAGKVIESDYLGGISTACLPGLARSINTEYPNIKCTWIDINHTDLSMATLREVFCRRLGDIAELAIRGDRLFCHSLGVIEDGHNDIELVPSALGEKILVEDFPSLKNPDAPFLRVARPQAEEDSGNGLAEHALEIEVDYFIASHWDKINGQLATYPDNPDLHFFRYAAGIQCVGYIARKGHAIGDFTRGDAVYSLYPHGMTNFAITAPPYVFRLPSVLQQARLPDIYDILRADHALATVAALPENAIVLIQGAWSSFVETLIHHCKGAGSTIIFVDEAPEAMTWQKQNLLADVHHVNSLSGGVVETVREIAQGVDVLFNSGLNACQCLDVVKPFGRIVDFRIRQLAPRQDHPQCPSNSTYHLIDIDALIKQNPGYIRSRITAILDDIAEHPEKYSPLPAFGLADMATAASALKTGDATALHITMKDETVLLPARRGDASAPLSGTYLVTGGTQGFGLQCAKFLVQRGVRHLVLMSRRGLIDPDSVKTVNELGKQGVAVRICEVDITNFDALDTALLQIAESMPPIKGILHSAMVLDDVYIGQVSQEKLLRVMAPKIQGAVNLYLATRNHQLDTFLMFSSISSVIGNAGQANYVAANSFLDAFAHYLAARGVPAKTVNWGALADAGVLADNAALKKILESAGIFGMTNQQAMQALGAALASDHAQIGAFSIDWARWRQSNPSLSASRLYGLLIAGRDEHPENAKLMEILTNIIDRDGDARREYVIAQLAERLGAIFKMPAEAINPHASIIDFGVDSLMASEISMALRSQLGVDVPAIDLISGPTVASLANRILEHIEALIEEVLAEDTQECESSA